MALGALEAQLKAMTECKICFDDKDHQKQLPCQHTLCLDCLNNLKVEKNKYKCPLCNTEYLVPNGGFDTLPESLITKQLAALLHTREWETAATQQRRGSSPKTVPSAGGETNDESQESGEQVTETEAGKKLKFGAQQGRNALNIAKQKIETCSQQEVELQRNLEVMKEKINALKAEKIAAIEERATKKLEAVRKATEIKTNEVSAREDSLKSLLGKNSEIVDELDRLASELNSTGTERDVSDELHKASSSVSKLSKLFSPPDAAGFKAGDSVRLRMEVDDLSVEFFDQELTHDDIGYILERNEKEQCAVIFPNHSAWTGKLSQLEKSAQRHSLPTKGDRVRVKASVKTPHFEWGAVKHGSVGVLTELKNKGAPTRREVEVNFPEDNDWKCFYDELEVAPPEPLLVGDEVWVKKCITEPAGGWAGVTHNSVGTLLSVNGEDVVVNFTECKEWRGLLTELEKVRPISIGDKVKVLDTVSEPKTGWAGVSHKDQGIVKLIHDHDEHGKVAVIDFPHRLGLWKCIVSELELVERQAEGDKSEHVVISGGGLEDMQRMHHRVMQRQAEQCAQQ